MLPEVKRYVDSLSAYDAKVRDLQTRLDEEYDRDVRASLRAEIRTLHNERDKAVRAANETLAEETSDELVAYAANEWLPHYHSETLTVLTAWPCSLDRLRQIAREAGWCSVWQDAVMDAVDDGALELTPAQLATFKLERELSNDLSYHEVADVMELVEELIKTRVEAALAELAVSE